jgi:hypothetical protein
MSSNPFPNNPFFVVPPFDNDPFDNLLNRACSIWKKQSTGTNSYGQPIETFVLLVDDVPCFEEQQTGKELNVPPAPASETSLGVKTYLILMRPIKVDSPPVKLNNHHYLQTKDPGDPTLDPNDPNSGAILYNVTDVDNPSQMNHHFQVMATVIEP